jgi:hypothetical protein
MSNDLGKILAMKKSPNDLGKILAMKKSPNDLGKILAMKNCPKLTFIRLKFCSKRGFLHVVE